MTTLANLEVFSARVCPFAHRTRLVLAEKGLDFTLTEIEFDKKPDRFLKVSRYGRVPAIVHDGLALYESSIVNEYLDEVFPTPALMPSDPGRRAEARIWIDYCDSRYIDDHYKALKNQDPAQEAHWRDKVNTHLQVINEAMAGFSEAGPFWLGEEVSLVDFAYYPFFERLPAWEHYRGLGIPEDCQRVRPWFDAMSARASVKAIGNDAAYYIKHYAGYAGAAVAAE